MNNLNETIGLRVLNISPDHLASNINVNGNISIEFSADINVQTLLKNIVVLEDADKIYKDINSLKDYSPYSVCKGDISYDNRVLTFTPKKVFNENSSYIVMLNTGIADVTGNHLIKKYISVFYTEQTASYPKCEIVSPKYGLIAPFVPEFGWKSQGAPSYVFQVSKSNSFELLLYEKIVLGNEVDEIIKHEPEIDNIQEGCYFVRVKSENGEWSNIHQFFLKPVSNDIVAQEDLPDLINYQDFIDNIQEPIEILERFPAPDSVENSLKTNIIYIKIKGEIDENRINFNNSYVVGNTLDEEHEEYSQNIVNGTWSRIYDSDIDATYIIFTPDVLEE